MQDTEIARIAVEEGLISTAELDRMRSVVSSQGGDLISVMLQNGLLRTTDVDRIKRDRGTATTTHVPGEIVTTAHTRLIPQEVQDAAADPRSAFGRYTLLEKIGSGGMGTIWKAWDNMLGRWAAIKMLHEEHAVHDDHRERFLREARAAARLAHPNIVQVYEVGMQGNVVFIALEFVPGETLRNRIAHRAVGPEMRRRIELARQAAEGLGSAHAAGITHRDMKPENVLVVPTPKGGQAKVVDFGLAVDKTAVTRLTVAGDVFGTPAYMAPEQALGLQEIVGPPADVFAVGCILYEIVAGKLPFEAEQAAASVYNTIHSDPVPLSKAAPKVHPDLDTIVSKCLEKEPERRYQDAKELADDLGRYMAGEPILARPIGFLGRWKRRAARNPALAFAIAAAVLLPMALISIFVYESRARAENLSSDLALAASLEEQAATNPELYIKVAGMYQAVAREEPGNEAAIAGMARAAKAMKATQEQDKTVIETNAARTADRAEAALFDPVRVPAAPELCDVLVADYPDFPRSRRTRALFLWRFGYPAAALAELDEARLRWVESPALTHVRVLSLIEAGRLEAASPLISQKPEDVAGAVELAALRLAQGRRDEARMALGLVKEPTAESLWIEGRLNARSGGWKAGRAEFERALRLDPTFVPAGVAAVLAAEEESRVGALAPARRLAAWAPAQPAVRALLAQVLAESGDLPSAAEEAALAARLAPVGPFLLRSGAFRLAAGDPSGVADLQAAGR